MEQCPVRQTDARQRQVSLYNPLQEECDVVWSDHGEKVPTGLKGQSCPGLRYDSVSHNYDNINESSFMTSVPADATRHSEQSHSSYILHFSIVYTQTPLAVCDFVVQRTAGLEKKDNAQIVA